MSTRNEVTQLLLRWRQDPQAAEKVLAETYKELRRIAHGFMRRERQNHTLQPTALVHEAYLRLLPGDVEDVASKTAFLGLMGWRMKRQLVDHARRRNAEKRGGGLHHQSLGEIDIAASDSGEGEDFLGRLDQALANLASEHPRVADVIRLKFIADLSIEDTAAELGVGTGTVKRDYAFGKVWLIRALEEP